MSETWYCDDHVDLRAAECPMCLTEQNAALTLRAEKAEAAVARVRAVCDAEFGLTGRQMMNPGRLGYRRGLRNVLDALDEVTA